MKQKRNTDTPVDVTDWPVMDDIMFERDELLAMEQSRVWLMYRKALRDRLKFLHVELRKHCAVPTASGVILGKIMGLESALNQFEQFYAKNIRIPAQLPDAVENAELSAAMAADEQRAERSIREQLETEHG